MSLMPDAALTVPSLPWSQHHGITFLPSLMPKISSDASTTNVRDEQAEIFQRQQIWQMSIQDLSLLLRLPTIEFFSHALFNKSLHRFTQSFLTQMQGLWQEAGGKMDMWNMNGEEDSTEEKKSSSESTSSNESLDTLRGIAKRVLLMYVRLCTIDVPATSGLAGSNGSDDTTARWLTPTFFTTSFSASAFFAPAALLDLVTFYSAVDGKAHKPLLKFILQTLWNRLPYAFTTGMSQSFGVLIQTLAQQVKLIHAPYVSGNGGKKVRFVRDELKALVRNLVSLLFGIYSVCELRPEFLRVLIQGVIPRVEASSKNPAFLTILTSLYTITPLLLLHELGVKNATLTASEKCMQLRRGALCMVRLIFRGLILPAMGIQSRKGQWIWKRVKSTSGEKTLSSTQATTSSTLPQKPTTQQATELFHATFKLIYDTVTVDAKDSNNHFSFLPASMKNLVGYNTSSTQFALLKRYNEYFELDTLLAFLREQSLDSSPQLKDSPGQILGRKKIEETLALLQQIDPPLIKTRIGWPLAQPKGASSFVSAGASMGGFEDGEERKSSSSSSAPSLVKSHSTKSTSGSDVDMSLAISSLHDLFPHFSTDYIGACLSEFNGSVEDTTNAILQEKLPGYLADIKDKGRYKAGDQQNKSKLKSTGPPGMMHLSRQSSTGSGMLDQPVDDEDAAIDKIGSLGFDGTGGDGDIPDDEFEAFLKRTGRVTKPAGAKGSAGGKGAETMLNSFSKSDALLLANKITQSLARVYDDEYDDGFDAFERFAVESDPLELEENEAVKSLYDSKTDGATDGAGDEPDGRAYQSKLAPQPFQSSGRAGMRGGRGGSASSRGGGGRSGGMSSTLQLDREKAMYEQIEVPAHFRPDPNPSKNVAEQWRRDAERKEIYIATLKAQKAQALAPSRRSAEQSLDYEHGLRYGLIENREQPNASTPSSATASNVPPQQQKGTGGKNQQQPSQSQENKRGEKQAQSARGSQDQRQQRDNINNNNQPRQNQNQQPSGPRQYNNDPSQQPQRQHQDRAPRQLDDSDRDQPSSGRAGFSARGGRGGSRGGLSAAATSFQPRDEAVPLAQQRPTSAASQQGQQRAPPQQQIQRSDRGVPDQWDAASASDDSGSGDEGGASNSQQQSGGSYKGQPMDPAARRAKEANKARSANHNRKAGALRKQGIKF